ncbi:MAG TPA: hypothetical protein VN914_09090 [Polyangia bacterium]|nr:hypothetical protein [Polyangia bacterium]
MLADGAALQAIRRTDQDNVHWRPMVFNCPLARIVVATIVAAGCRLPEPAPPPPVRRVPGFLKGQTHAHSNNSGDSDTPAADVLRWYAARGYDFVVFTDHNYVTVVPPDERPPGILAIPGAELTENLRSCEPPPPRGLSCLLHVNALFLPNLRGGMMFVRHKSERRFDVFQGAVRAAVGSGGLAQINHPNFHYAADSALLAAVTREGATFLEIANEAIDSNNAGDAGHPGTEALWDAVLSTGATIWGVASDDAHHYDDAAAVRASGEMAFTGDRGFVMVRAPKDVPAIRAAMARGDFYSSNGVLLSGIDRDADGALFIQVAEASPEEHRILCIGKEGRVLAEMEGRAGRCPPPAPGGYVRAVVVDRAGRRAWVQPSTKF